MAVDLKLIALSTLYVVLAFVLVSLKGTYSLTKNVFGNLFSASAKANWPTGNDLGNAGFLLHVVVFALLVALPMFFCKSK